MARIYRNWPKKTVQKWFKMRQKKKPKTYKAIGLMYNPPLKPQFVFEKIQELHSGVLK